MESHFTKLLGGLIEANVNVMDLYFVKTPYSWWAQAIKKKILFHPLEITGIKKSVGTQFGRIGLWDLLGQWFSRE